MCSVTCSATARDYGFAPKLHDDLGTALGDMDFEAAAKLSGARFVVLKGGWRGSSARSASSCSICTSASTAIPRSIRRCWCATPSCSVPDSCRNSRTTSSGRSRASCSPRPDADLRQRAPRPDPDCGGLADQPRSQVHPRRERAADAAHRADAVLPRRGWRCRAATPAA